MITNDEKRAIFDRLDRIDSTLKHIDMNLKMLVEGFQSVCTELRIRERIAEIRDTLPEFPQAEESSQHGQ